MTHFDADFSDALKEAQDRGFAEADPTLDINGTDAAHKLAILGGLAFNCRIAMEDIFVEGIENIDIVDIRSALEMGYILKLLAIGEKKRRRTNFASCTPIFHPGTFAAGPGRRPFQCRQRFRKCRRQYHVLRTRRRHDADRQCRGCGHH